ncbi:MAG: FadR/GntR family transcriptional regulator [Anaerolineae bacterium]
MALPNEEVQAVGGYHPVRAHNAYEAVVHRLEQEVLSGRLSPGTRLPSMTELSRGLRVSVPVVREAIMSLRAKGLLDVRHGSGTYVSDQPHLVLHLPLELTLPITTAHLLYLFDIRLPLEVRAAELAAATRGSGNLAPLEEAVAAMARANQADDWQGFFDADKGFHLSLAALSGNPFLPVILAPILDLVMAAHPSPGDGSPAEPLLPRAPALLHHRGLIAALRDGNPEMAVLVMRQHLLSDVRSIKAYAPAAVPTEP